MGWASLGAGVYLLRTRSGRYRVALVPLAACPIPGFRATAVQAVPLDGGAPRPGDDRRRTVRLVYYERTVLPPASPSPARAPRRWPPRPWGGGPGATGPGDAA